MTVADIIQIVIGIASFFATIFVGYSIYWLQKRHENQVRSENKRRDENALSETAKIFIIDNDKEIDYLPLCVMAVCESKFRSHHRDIYTRFSRCSLDLQQEILKQQNIPLIIIENDNWIDDSIEKIEKDISTYKLGKSMLYDGAKYLHYSNSEFNAELIVDCNPAVFEMPIMSELVKRLKDDNKFDLTLYIDRYLEFVLKDREDTKDKPELLPNFPPLNLVYTQENLGSCDLIDVCFWVMRSIISVCIALFRHDIVKGRDEEWRMIGIGDARIETYEDMYYETLLQLFTAYQNIDMCQNGEDEKNL